MHESDVLRLIGQILDAVVHGEGDVHHIAFLPFARDGDIGRRPCDDADRLAVDHHLELTRLYPSGIAYEQVESPLALSDGDTAGLSIGEVRLLAKDDAFFLPVEF